MSEKRVTKKAIVASLLSVAVCSTMLVGTSYAWFTDTASSNGNVITSGKLSIDLSKGTYNADEQNFDYVSLKTTHDPIFNYNKWEPGYTEWANVKVSTDGNLALKYTLNFVSNEDIASAELANAIDVYYSPSQIAKPNDRPDDLSQYGSLRKLGTLADVFTGGAQYEIKDYLIPEAAAKNAADVNTEDFATIVFKMQEEAGNEYQNKTIPAFDLAVVATQYTYEDDTFNDQYDKNAQFPIVVKSRAAFSQALNDVEDGGTIQLEPGLDLGQNIKIDNGKTFNIDLNGNTFSKGIRLEDADVTFSNGTITNAGGQGLQIVPKSEDSTTKVTVGKDVTVNGSWGITLFKAAESDKNGNTVVDMYGTVNGNIFVQGLMEGGNSVVNIYGTVNGGEVANTIGVAVNGHATVNVFDGADIKGGTGIEVRAGNLNVYGGTITGVATPTNVNPNGSGTTTVGAGIGVSQHTTQLPINVNISGGTIKGHTALYEANPQNNPDEKLATIKINVTGGTFDVINGGTNKFNITDKEKLGEYKNIYGNN